MAQTKVVTIKECADLFGISLSLVRKAIQKGKLTPVEVQSAFSTRRISALRRKDVERWRAATEKESKNETLAKKGGYTLRCLDVAEMFELDVAYITKAIRRNKLYAIRVDVSRNRHVWMMKPSDVKKWRKRVDKIKASKAIPATTVKPRSGNTRWQSLGDEERPIPPWHDNAD